MKKLDMYIHIGYLFVLRRTVPTYSSAKETKLMLRQITVLAVACAVGLLLSAGRVSAAGEPIDLAALADWDIVVAEDAIASESYAAREFQKWFGEATGQSLPIVSKVDRPVRHVFIGAGPAMLASPVGFEAAQMPAEDFRIVARDGCVAIAGGQPRGTLYGVYQLLEDEFGVRFLTFDHTHVPQLPAKPLLKTIDRAVHPPLTYRCSYYGENFAHPDFATRLRGNAFTDDPQLGGRSRRQLINHSFAHQIPSKSYGVEHPEYFALRGDKRLAPVEDDFFGTEPCLTNPEVLKIVTAQVLKEVDEHPDRENVSVSQNDNNLFCLCPDCSAIDRKEGTPMGSLLTFVNSVAEQVESRHPQVKVGTLAYWYSRRPPLSIVPRKNVQIQLCSIECCLTHPITDANCPLNREFCDDMRRWGQLCDDIAIWNYNTNFSSYQLPNPNLRAIDANVRYFVENHARGIFMQAAGNTTGAEFSDLRNYLISRLLWNPELSGSELIDEFLNLHYGTAAPPIRSFIELVHDQAQASGKHQNCFGNLAKRGLDASLGERGIALFDEALRLAASDQQRQWVEKASLCAYRAAIEPSWILDSEDPLDEALATQQRPLVKKFFELCEKHQVPMVSERTTTAERLKDYKRLFRVAEPESL